MNDNAVSEPLADLLERLEARESVELEFKAAKGGLPSSIWPTVSAFANTAGGWLVLGVSEAGDGSPVIEGVENAARLIDQFTQLTRNPQKISSSPCGAQDAWSEEIGGAAIVIVRVPAAERSTRPVYIDGNPYSGTYLRRAAGNYRCTKREVDRMMREAGDVPADRLLVPWATLDDLDRTALHAFRQMHQTAVPTTPWASLDDERFLEAIGGIRHDRLAGERGITVAGLLMFGQPTQIREWRGRHLIDFRVVEDRDDLLGQPDWLDRAEWDGHLFGALRTLLPRIWDGWPIPFRLEGAVRVQQTPWHTALREAFVNLLVHADYRESIPSLVLRSDRRCLFRNPGASRVTQPGSMARDRSDPRNPTLLTMFRMIGFSEEAGSGLPRIFAALDELDLAPPDIRPGSDAPDEYEFSIALQHVHVYGERDAAWLARLGPDLDRNHRLALLAARQWGAVDNQTVRELTGIHPADATAVLASLRHRGLLRRHGSRRGAFYDPTDDARRAWAVPNAVAPPRRTYSGTHSASIGTSIGTSTAQPTAKASDNLPIDSRQPLLAGGRVRASDALASAIMEACDGRWLSRQQIARRLGRSPDWVRKALIDLVASGDIVREHPHQPRHPRQRYRTATPQEPA